MAVETAGCTLSTLVYCVQTTTFFGVNRWEEKSKRKGVQMQSTGENKVTEDKLVQLSFIMIELWEVVDCIERGGWLQSNISTFEVSIKNITIGVKLIYK